ncbi:uncharacterized protein EAE98_008469 [Botrytis deweyae]|uniref:Cytochrome P450 n=1 Tax=Botrytis deweyae TaxID=2478750 RepID=A0ABQ7IEB4_9HELO|nr:uncharacterized protein EAE98_008469 [Botrytis deweyae]KAF7921622.1 hypothetical protein EAE98_008469 [Botrytis deweyae]
MANMSRNEPQNECFAEKLLHSKAKENLGDESVITILAMALEIEHVVGPSRLPDWADRSNLPYIGALIKELHRWSPISICGRISSISLLNRIKLTSGVALGIPHAATEDIMYGDYFIPEGAILLPNTPSLSRSPVRYNNPNAFNPLRFLEDRQDAAASARNSDFMDRDHFEFGFGHRFCPGSHVADSSLYISIARILWGFDIAAIDQVPLDMKDQRMPTAIS